jgi:integrase
MFDVTGRRRSPAATPGFLCGRVPPNKGRQYPPDPPRPEEIIQVMRQAGQTRPGLRIRALIAALWRGGLRISEALALTETDIDKRRGALLIRHRKGDRRREVSMDDWGFERLDAWLEHRVQLSIGPLFCVIDGPTCGRPWAATAARAELRRPAADAGLRRRFAPHQLRHGHAVEPAREGVPVNRNVTREWLPAWRRWRQSRQPFPGPLPLHRNALAGEFDSACVAPRSQEQIPERRQ